MPGAKKKGAKKPKKKPSKGKTGGTTRKILGRSIDTADLGEILLEVNRRWLSTLDLEKLLSEVGMFTRALLRADDVSLLLVDGKGKELVEHVIISHRRAPDNRYRIRINDEGVTGWVATNRKPLSVADVKKDKRYVPAAESMRSELAVPVLAGDRLLGVLNCESSKAGHFKKADVMLLEVLASQVAIALENAEAHDKAQGRARQLQVLHHLARASDGAIPAQTFLQRAVDAVRREFGCYYAAAFLADYDRERIVLLSQSCVEPIGIDLGASEPFGTGIIGTAVKIGETFNVRNVRQDPTYADWVPDVMSEVAVPIRIGDHCLGMIDAQSQQIEAFDSEDVVFLETVARMLVPTMQILAKSPPKFAMEGN